MEKFKIDKEALKSKFNKEKFIDALILLYIFVLKDLIDSLGIKLW